jgi:biotin carboxylase
MSRRKIAVLGANLPLLNFYRRAQILNYEIHSFAWEDGAICKSLADFFYPISFTETQKIADLCKEKGIEMVTSFSLESALPSVYEIAQIMGWACPSESNRVLCANKLTMRKEFHRQGVSIPFFIDTDDNKCLVSSFPVIVKPIDSGGSRGVTRVDSFDQLPLAIDRAKSFSKNQRVLIEQYIDGPEFSVEVITHEAKHYIIAITEKITTGAPNFVELAHFQPAMVSDAERTKIIALVQQALDVLDHQEGPSHTEVRFDQKGNCFIIEVGTRLGGDFITSDLVRLSTGYDLVEASIELACGNFIIPEITEQKFSGVYFKSPETMEMWKSIALLRTKGFFIESEEWSKDNKVLTESSDRLGYYIYQHDERLKLNGTF